MFLLGLVGLTLQFAMALALALLGRAPRWRHAAWFAGVAFTAGLYSTVNAFGALQSEAAGLGWVLRANLLNGTLHGAAWLLFTHLQPGAHWRDIPLPIRRAAVAGSVLVFLVVASPFAVKPVTGDLAHVPGFGGPVPHVELSTLGSLFALVPIGLLAVSAYRYVQQYRAGETGTGLILIGFVFFLATVLEEVLVAAGVIKFIYLADVGYISVVAPVTVHLLRGFVRDARTLDELRGQLEDEVERRTVERDEARQLVVDQQRLAALGRLAAGVAHEVNSPLQYLRLSLDELEAMPVLRREPAAMEHLGHAFEGVDRVRHIVDALRTYSRPAGADHIPLDVRDVVRAALRVGASHWRTDVTMDVQLHAVPLVRGQEGRLVQAVLNALVNAVNAVTSQPADRPRRVSVRTSTTLDGWAEIRVTDSGPGFPPEIQERLGEPFVTTRADRGGTGLGMFVLRGIVQTHDGRLKCRNAPEGGAQVVITLPPADVSAPTPTTPQLPAPSPPVANPSNETEGLPALTMSVFPLQRVKSPVRRAGTSVGTAVGTSVGTAAPTVAAPAETSVAEFPIRIVMVEDDAASLRAYIRGLTAEGFAVHGFTDATSALVWLERHAADIVVTDLTMPGMSGSEFAAQLGLRFPDLRDTLIVLTGGAVSHEAEQFLRSESVRVLEKPISRAVLAAEVRRRLAHWRLERAQAEGHA